MYVLSHIQFRSVQEQYVGGKFSKNLGSAFKILGARMMPFSGFRERDIQILITTVKSLAACTIWCPGFVYPCHN